VHGNKVSPHAKENQVAVLPELTEVDVEEGFLGGQDRSPLLRRGGFQSDNENERDETGLAYLIPERGR
jgi:hypothetical protein